MVAMSNLDGNLRYLKYCFRNNDLGRFASFCVLLIMVKSLNIDICIYQQD
jgi:hypothetical protein